MTGMSPVQKWLLLLALISFTVAANVWFYTDFLKVGCR